MMKHTRQELITLLHCNGIGLTGNETDKCLKLYNDKVSTPIKSGMKIKVFYMKQRQGKFKSIALPTDLEFVPNWFHDNIVVDKQAHIERLVDNPLGNILKAIGKKTPTKHSLKVSRAISF